MASKLPPVYLSSPYVAAEAPYRHNHPIPSHSSRVNHPPSAGFGSRSAQYEDVRRGAASPTGNDSNSSSNTPSSIPSGGSSTSRTSISTAADIDLAHCQKPLADASPTPIQPQPHSHSHSQSPPPNVDSHFETLMAAHRSALPEPGLAYFDARRALWLAEPPDPPMPVSPSLSRIKLEALLNQPGAVESDEVWRAGLKNVWKGLVGGNQLRKRLPLSIVLKILQAGWLRDGTWPEGTVAPAWEELPPPMQPSQLPLPGEPSPADFMNPASGPSHQHLEYAGLPHMQMLHLQIPLGYSPSSGDQPEQAYYVPPYAYAQQTPPLEVDAEQGVCATLPGECADDDDVDDDVEDMQVDGDVVMHADDGRHQGG
ncbi:hypothetical protein M0805_000578 [Coniferiporia weirii]|nr:hypothetical protein M0805_000578 [Coniferiporia weirii]